MLSRLASVALALSVALGLAGCTSAGRAPAPTAVPSAALPTSTPPATTVRASAPASAAAPDTGNVDVAAGPVLSVEPVSALTIRVTLADLKAKAWRVAVVGTGAAARDRWTLSVETGDVAPVVTTIETLGGVDGDPTEQPALESGHPTGRLCAISVAVCVRLASVDTPRDGNGALVLELTRTDTTTPLQVTGATATWTGEPFNLGPWTTTEAFPWGS